MKAPTVMLEPDLLEILRCPTTGQKLRPADAETLGWVNARLSQPGGDAGEESGAPLEAALVREDGQAAYPVRDGIPVLLADAAIPLT